MRNNPYGDEQSLMPLWICSEGGFMTKHLLNHFFSLHSQMEKGLESCWQEFFKSSLEMRWDHDFFVVHFEHYFILRIYSQWSSTCSLIISIKFKENLFTRKKKYKFMLSFLFLMIQHSNFHMTWSAQQKKGAIFPQFPTNFSSLFACKIKMSS